MSDAYGIIQWVSYKNPDDKKPSYTSVTYVYKPTFCPFPRMEYNNASIIIAINFKIYQNNKKNKARQEKWKELIQEVKLYPQDVPDETHPIIGREYREYFNNSTWKQIHNLPSK